MGVWDDTLPTGLAAADVITDSALLGKVMPLLTALTAPWTSFAPTWTASSGTPSLGNGSLTGAYRQVGKTVDYGGCLILGSTSSFAGTGVWRMSLPVTASTNITFHVGSAWFALPVYAGSCQLNSTTILEFTLADASLTSTTPVTPGTGDALRWSITYEAA